MSTYSPDAVRTLGDPAELFFNVNTAETTCPGGGDLADPRIISIIGRKNTGKTTLTVALAGEYVRRGGGS